MSAMSIKAARPKKVTPASVNIAFRSLKAAFNLAVKWRMATQNPFSESSQLPVVHRTRAFFTKEEFEKLLSLMTEP